MSSPYPLVRLLGASLILLLAYAAHRAMFIGYNADVLSVIQPWQPFIYLSGLRFDLSALAMSNILFVFLYVTSLFIQFPGATIKASRILFTGINGLIFLLSMVDMLYFPFVQKRLQFDAFLFLTGDKGTEFWQVLPVFIIQFWWAWLLGLGSFFLFDTLFTKWLQPGMQAVWKPTWRKKVAWMPVIALLYLTAMRGGWQLRPLGIMHATESVGPELAPAVMNTPFSLWRTLQKQVLSPVTYFSEHELTPEDQGLHQPGPANMLPDSHANVVIIMVESLSANLIGRHGGMTNTPFLDSLIEEGWYFPNTIANARESVEGVPAVLSSIPAWMDDPFLFSRYSTNQIESIASILAPKGYSSAFFHGAAKGTMGFDLYCRSAGFEHYMGKEQYPHAPRDFDGSWGIWDHKYLPYMAQELTKMPLPFVAAVLTLNSHHPFRLPEDMESRFRLPGHPILSSMGYVDMSLRLFFEEARKQPWFENTLFVLTADHPGPNAVPFRPKVDTYRVPLLWYHPSGVWEGKKGALASQVDIMPTLAAMLGVHAPFFAIGDNLQDSTTTHTAITCRAGVFQMFGDRFRIQFDGQKVLSCYDWEKDPLYVRPLNKGTHLPDDAQPFVAHLKKKIQAFTHAMANDKMTAKAYSSEWIKTSSQNSSVESNAEVNSGKPKPVRSDEN